MVEVSLERLVTIEGTRDVWPEKFRDLLAKLEEVPEERTQLKVIADWCQENSEAELARAFDWISRRPAVQLKKVTKYGEERWTLEGMPYALLQFVLPERFDMKTPAGCVADLAARLRKLTETLL